MIFGNPVDGAIHPADDVSPTGVFHVAQDFGCTGFPKELPLGSCPHFHRGLDIGNRECGADILAARGGRVWRSAVLADGNQYVWIDHGAGWFTLYGHLHDRVVIDRQVVAKGQLLGHMGQTGNATACHLHFGVKAEGDPDLNLFSDTNGTWQDPWTLLEQNGEDDVDAELDVPVITADIAPTRLFTKRDGSDGGIAWAGATDVGVYATAAAGSSNAAMPHGPVAIRVGPPLRVAYVDAAAVALVKPVRLTAGVYQVG